MKSEQNDERTGLCKSKRKKVTGQGPQGTFISTVHSISATTYFTTNCSLGFFCNAQRPHKCICYLRIGAYCKHNMPMSTVLQRCTFVLDGMMHIWWAQCGIFLA